MRHHCRLAAVSLLALAIAACGDPAEEADDPLIGTEETVPVERAPGGGIGEVGEAEHTSIEVPAAAETATAEPAASEPSPRPTPAATATRRPTPTPTPTPRQTQAAAMEPPAVFAQCSVCHSVEPGENQIGPTLAGVFGRRAGAVPGFNYSDAIEGSNLTWNQANLDRFLADPDGVVPGTTMALPGVEQGARRRIIEYLRTL